jgi:hypothetical protein
MPGSHHPGPIHLHMRLLGISKTIYETKKTDNTMCCRSSLSHISSLRFRATSCVNGSGLGGGFQALKLFARYSYENIGFLRGVYLLTLKESEHHTPHEYYWGGGFQALKSGLAFAPSRQHLSIIFMRRVVFAFF